MLKRNQYTICCYLRFNIVCTLVRVTSLSRTVPCNVRCHTKVSLEQEFIEHTGCSPLSAVK